MKHHPFFKVLICCVVGFGVRIMAADGEPPKQAVEARPQVQQGEIPEPVVTISQTTDSTVQEYRINGVLRAIKFIPKNGMPPYYLIDKEGSGEFIRLGIDDGKQLSTPRWIFFTW